MTTSTLIWLTERQNSVGQLLVVVATGVITPELAKVWRELRNKTAHAAELTLSSAELQVLFNQTCACLELFYRLIMEATGYKGHICQYSKPGWPEGSLAQPTLARGIT